MKTYKALRPAHINSTHLNEGDTIKLHERAAQFLIADGTLEETTKNKAAKPSSKKGA